MWTRKPWAVPGASAKPRSRRKGEVWTEPSARTQDSARDLLPPIRSLGQENWETRPSPGLAPNMNLQYLLSLGNFWKVCWFKVTSGISMTVQWLRLHLPMEGVWVRPLFGELRSHMPWTESKNQRQNRSNIVTNSIKTFWIWSTLKEKKRKNKNKRKVTSESGILRQQEEAPTKAL